MVTWLKIILAILPTDLSMYWYFSMKLTSEFLLNMEKKLNAIIRTKICGNENAQ